MKSRNKSHPWWAQHRDALWSAGFGFSVTAAWLLVSGLG